MFNPGGFGSEFYGDPFGSGGPLHLLDARAIAGQTLRVVFDREPLHESGAGFTDSWNPANYRILVTEGQAVAPLPIAVEHTIIAGPQTAVPDGAFAVDVRVDRPFIVGLGFQVTVANIVAKDGGAMGAPYDAPFTGIVPITDKGQPSRNVQLIDFAYSMLTGGLVFENGGDIGVQSGDEGLRKRILRRCTTQLNGFRFLNNYGVNSRLKQPLPPATLQDMRADLTQQIKKEPDVVDASATLQVKPGGALFVSVRARTNLGANITVAFIRDAQGGIGVP